MEDLKELINKVIHEESIIYAIFSGVRNKGEKTFNKVSIKKVIIQNEEKHQFEYFYDKNVEHKNLNNDETKAEIQKLIGTYFKQALINTLESDYHILVNKKGELKINRKTSKNQKIEKPKN